MSAIQDNNHLYNFLSPLVQFGTRCHYQSFVVHGLENLPTDGSCIIAPCHQQALMEPLAVLCFSKKPPVFLARADIFQKPTIRAILTFLKILPVYRIRDGKSNLSKNTEIFDLSRDVLLDGYPLCLMAEGRHNNRHHLLPFGKGMFRIAGETQLKLSNHPLYIVPTGIDFDEYERPYSNVVVNIGKPIAVQSFMSHWQDNEAVALNEMKQALATALSPLMHDIRDEEHYDEIYTLCNILNSTLRHRGSLPNNAWNRFITRQKITALFDTPDIAITTSRNNEETSRNNVITELRNNEKEVLQELFQQVRSYQEACRQLNLGESDIPDHWSLPTTLLALLFPLALLAAIALLPPVRWLFFFCLLCYPVTYLPTHLLVKRLIADPQFRSSVNFGIRFFLSIIYGIVIGIVMACTGGAWMSRLADLGVWWGLIAVALVHIHARLAAPTNNALRALGRNLRFWWLRLSKGKQVKALQQSFLKIKEESF